MNSYTSMVRLWQLISPSLPVGSFSYSQGLEYAIEAGWLKTEADVECWLQQQMHFGLARLDLPLILRQMDCWAKNDEKKIEYWNQTILAFRESSELYHEDCQVGYALGRLLIDIGIQEAKAWQISKTQKNKASYTTMYALVCQRWNINPDDAIAGFAWAWCENLVAAAVKLLPMGQTGGQKMLLSLGNQIESTCLEASLIEDDALGSVLPGLSMASAFHETQYSRLFRS